METIINKVVQGAKISNSSEKISIDAGGKLDLKKNDFVAMDILGATKDIFRNSLPKSSMVSLEIHGSARASRGPAERIPLPEDVRYDIHLVSLQIAHKVFKGANADSIVKDITEHLEKFQWEEKMVLVLAAYAVVFGEHWFFIGPMEDNPLLPSFHMYKQLQWLRGSAFAPNFPLNALEDLINSMLDLAYCIIQLNDYRDVQSESVEEACKLIIKSVVRCQIYCVDLLNRGIEHLASTEEILAISGELKHKYIYLSGMLKKLFNDAEKDSWKKPCDDVTIRIGNFFPGGDSLVMWMGSSSETKLAANEDWLDKLKGRHVALFISSYNFDVNLEEYKVLVRTYKKIKEGKNGKNFEVIWIPMADESIQEAEMKDIVNNLVDGMPWYFFCYPTSIKNSFRFYIRNEWHFQKQPLLVVLDNKGNVTSPDAFPIVTILGDSAYPFTSSMEDLWKMEKIIWNVKFLVKDIDLRTLEMIKEEKLVCFYSGGDLEWIRNFSKTMRKVMKETRIALELIYIGISGQKEKLQQILAAFAEESMSDKWSTATIRSFWSRFQSIYHSRKQYCETTNVALENDTVMKELMKISTYDSKGHGWALMFRGSSDTVIANGKQLMDILEHYMNWREKVHKASDFLRVLREQMSNYRCNKHCIETIIPMRGWFNPGNITCVECGRIMERYCLYKCCIE